MDRQMMKQETMEEQMQVAIVEQVRHTVEQPNLYHHIQDEGQTQPMFDLARYEGVWMWSYANGFEVHDGTQFHGFDEANRMVSRPANGFWADFGTPNQHFIENDTMIPYRIVQGPDNVVNIDGTLFRPMHIRIDELGRRVQQNSDGRWTVVVGQSEPQMNPDGTRTTVNTTASLSTFPSTFPWGSNDPEMQWPVPLPPVPQDDPYMLWMGLRSVAGAFPPLPERIDGAVPNAPLRATAGSGSSTPESSRADSPDARLTQDVWRNIDNWLTQAFPLDQYPAAGSLDQRLMHIDAYMPRLPPPALKFPETDAEKMAMWGSVSVELIVPCAPMNTALSRVRLQGDNGQNPFPVYYMESAVAEVARMIQVHMETFAANDVFYGMPKHYFQWTWDQEQEKQANPSMALTDDQDRWYWTVQHTGQWHSANSSTIRDIPYYTFLISSPAYSMNSPGGFELAGRMLNALDGQLPWAHRPTQNTMSVEVGPARGCHFSTQQLRDMASFWYACEPYLTSLLKRTRVDKSYTHTPCHGRVRACWGEPAERANWLCRLQRHGGKFPAYPLLESRRCPEPTQDANDLAENGPQEVGTYGVAEGRTVARGSTIVHNGVDPVNSFFGTEPRDHNGDSTGKRHNLWRLNRHEVINNIQRAASSPAVAWMMQVGVPPVAGYLDLGNYTAPRLGQDPPRAQRSVSVRMAPTSLKNADVAAWAMVTGGILLHAATRDWDSLCALMPPPHELLRSADHDVRNPNTRIPSFPTWIETRYSEKFDVFDMLHKLGFDQALIGYIETQMLTGHERDGHMFSHRCEPIQSQATTS